MKSKQLLRAILMLLSVAMLSTSVLKAQQFDRQAMLENLAYNVILPSHESFEQSANELEQSVKAFIETADQAQLELVQASWLKAVINWQSSNLFSLGDLKMMVLHNQISKAINPKLIEESIMSGETLNADFIDQQGSSSRH